MKVELQPAFVLHIRSFKETSLIAEVLTRDYGLISVVAKGAKRPKSPLRSVLAQFCEVVISLVGRTELVTLTTVELNGGINYLRGQKLISAMYLNELITRLLAKWDPHPEIFDLYKETILRLSDISSSDEGVQIALRNFEINLLKSVGYGLRFEKDLNGDVVREDRWYSFIPTVGLRKVERDERGVVISGRSLLGIVNGELNSDQILRDAKRIMRVAINHHLVGRSVESRKLL